MEQGVENGEMPGGGATRFTADDLWRLADGGTSHEALKEPDTLPKLPSVFPYVKIDLRKKGVLVGIAGKF